MKFVLFSPRRNPEISLGELEDFLGAAHLQPGDIELRMLDSEDAQLGDLTGIDGIFVGGSPYTITGERTDPAQDPICEKLLDLATVEVPVLYVCFGAHVLAHTGGGKITRDHPETAGLTTVYLTKDAQFDPLAANLPQSFEALTGHNENVEEIPDGATLLAHGSNCPVQFYRVGQRYWATQFHPELDAPGLATRMSHYKDHGYFDVDEYEAIISRAEKADLSYSRSIISNFVDFCRKEKECRGNRPAQAESVLISIHTVTVLPNPLGSTL